MDRYRFRNWNKKTEEYDKFPEYDYIGGTSNIITTDDNIAELCTGMKDKNGKLIFESDIVCYDVDSERTGRIATVEFRQAHFVLVMDGEDVYDAWKALNIEVIGNIHQNKELLNDRQRL